MDGLPVHTVTEQLALGQLPEIQKFFLSDKKPLYRARTTFPSLTYPAITSLLTEKSVEKNGVFGNTVLTEQELLNFEIPSNYPKLNDRIRGQNIFSRLSAKGFSSVSLDYNFFADTQAHTNPADANVGLGILNQSYNIPDRRQIKSLEMLLSKNKPENWPDFIFIHLTGVDFNSHDFGPGSKQVKSYLHKLDEQLGPLFEILQKAETLQQRQVIAMLSADHGFDVEITKRLDFTESVRRLDKRTLVINEGRFAGVYFPLDYNEKQRAAFLKYWAQNPEIDIVASREGEQIFIKSSSLEIDVTYKSENCREETFSISVNGKDFRCTEQLSPETQSLFYPYFVANLSLYFQTPHHPDAIVIPKPGVSFHEKVLGQHGGPTPRELFVPLFIHGAKLEDTTRVPALWELLRFL